MTKAAAAGPSTIARRAPPSRCPLVPGPTGKLIICAAKTNAPITPSKGMRRSCVSRCARRATQATVGALATSSAIHTGVLRNPSGICIEELQTQRRHAVCSSIGSTIRNLCHHLLQQAALATLASNENVFRSGRLIIGTGIDLCEVERIRNAIASPHGRRLVERVFTAREIAYAERKAHPYERYAARFAAKEAGMKALGTGWQGGVSWHDLEVVNESSGRPALKLHG